MKKGIGGVIERGKILSEVDGGYKIASLDRDGIETPPITPIEESKYTIGDMVYFFYFNDGTGKIICKI